MRNYDLDDDDDEIIKQLMKNRPIASLGNARLGTTAPVPPPTNIGTVLFEAEEDVESPYHRASSPGSKGRPDTGGALNMPPTSSDQLGAAHAAAMAKVAKQKALERRLKETYGLATQEENLGLNFFMTPWVAPSFEKVADVRQAEAFRGGDESPSSLPIISSPELGLGVRLYFQFLYSITVGLAVMTLLSIPLLVFAYSSHGMADSDRDAAGLYQLTLGNLGFQSAAPENNFLQKVHLCSDADLAARGLVCVNVLGFLEVTVGDMQLVILACELLQVFVFLITVRHLNQQLIKLKRPDKAENLVSTTHYAVYVENLPPFVTQQEVIAHFSNLYQLQNVDWRNRLPIEDARPVQAADNTAEDVHVHSWVAECTLYRRIGTLVRRYQRKEPMFRKLVRSRALMKRFAVDTVHPRGGDRRQYYNAEIDFLEISREVDAFFAMMQHTHLKAALKFRHKREQHQQRLLLKDDKKNTRPATAPMPSRPTSPAGRPMSAAATASSNSNDKQPGIRSGSAPSGAKRPSTASVGDASNSNSNSNNKNSSPGGLLVSPRASSLSLAKTLSTWFSRKKVSGKATSADVSTAGGVDHDAAVDLEMGLVSRPQSRGRGAGQGMSRPSSPQPLTTQASRPNSPQQQRPGTTSSTGPQQPPPSLQHPNDTTGAADSNKNNNSDRSNHAVATGGTDAWGNALVAGENHSSNANHSPTNGSEQRPDSPMREKNGGEDVQIFVLDQDATNSNNPASSPAPPSSPPHPAAPAEEEVPMEPVTLEDAEVAAGFIVFEYNESAARCLEDYSFYSRFPFSLFYPPQLRLQGRRLKVTRAPEPDQIVWENLELPNHVKRLLAFRTLLISLCLILCGFVFVFLGGSLRSSYREQIPSTDLCIDAIPALYAAKNYTNRDYIESLRLKRPPTEVRRVQLDGQCIRATGYKSAFYAVYSAVDDFDVPVAKYDFAACSSTYNATTSTNTTGANYYFNSSAPLVHTSKHLCPLFNASSYCPCLTIEREETCELVPCQLHAPQTLSTLSTRSDLCSVSYSDIAACHCATLIPRWLDFSKAVGVLQRKLRGETAVDSSDYRTAQCGDYDRVYYLAQTIDALIPLCTVGINRLLKMALVMLAQYEGRSSLDEIEASVLTKLFTTTFINMAGVLLLAYALSPPSFLLKSREKTTDGASNDDNGIAEETLRKYTDLSFGPHTDFNRAWFGDIGYYVVTTFFIASMTPLAGPYLYRYIIKPIRLCIARRSLLSRHKNLAKEVCCPRGPVQQSEINDLMLQKPFMFTAHAAQLLSLLFVAMTFAPGIPILMPLCTLLAVSFFRLDRYTLLYLARRPPGLDERLLQRVFVLLPLAAVFRLSAGLWMFSAADIFVPDTFPHYAATASSGGGASGIGNTIVPFLSLTRYQAALHSLRRYVAAFHWPGALDYIVRGRMLRPMSFPLSLCLALLLFTLLVQRLLSLLPLARLWRSTSWLVQRIFCRARLEADAFSKSRAKGYVHPFELISLLDPLRSEAAPFTGIYYQFLRRKTKGPSLSTALWSYLCCCFQRLSCCCCGCFSGTEDKKKAAMGGTNYSSTGSVARSNLLAEDPHNNNHNHSNNGSGYQMTRKVTLKPQEEADGWEIVEMGLDFEVKVKVWRRTELNVHANGGDASLGSTGNHAQHMAGQHKRTFEVLRDYRCASYRMESLLAYRAAFLALRDSQQSLVSLVDDYRVKLADYPLRKTFDPRREEDKLRRFFVDFWLRRAQTSPEMLLQDPERSLDEQLDDELRRVKQQAKEDEERRVSEGLDKEAARAGFLARFASSRKSKKRAVHKVVPGDESEDSDEDEDDDDEEDDEDESGEEESSEEGSDEEDESSGDDEEKGKRTVKGKVVVRKKVVPIVAVRNDQRKTKGDEEVKEESSEESSDEEEDSDEEDDDEDEDSEEEDEDDDDDDDDEEEDEGEDEEESEEDEDEEESSGKDA